MTVTELKNQIHSQIDQCNDIDLLQSIFYMLEYKDKTFVTPEKMKEGILLGVKGIQKGQILNMKDFEKKVREIL